jgi:hypothetical protein
MPEAAKYAPLVLGEVPLTCFAEIDDDSKTPRPPMQWPRRRPTLELSRAGRMPSNTRCLQCGNWSSNCVAMERRTGSSYGLWLGAYKPTGRIEVVLMDLIRRVSYRDLLGTAERIIEMDTQMHEVDTILGQAAQKCNSGAVDRIFKNYGRVHNENRLNSKRRVNEIFAWN